MDNQSKKDTGDERRRFFRETFHYPIFCTRMSNCESFKAISANICIEGLMFISSEPFKKNELLNIEVLYQTFSSKDKTSIKSKVVWIEKNKTKENGTEYYIGIQFQNLNEKQRTILNNIAHSDKSF